MPAVFRSMVRVPTVLWRLSNVWTFGWIILIATASHSSAKALPLAIPPGGQGLSLAFRDARVLSEELIANSDWDAAAHRYAERHDQHYSTVSKVTGWFYDMFQRPGPEAEARRAHALPLIGSDPTRVPDVLFSGPDFPLTADAKARFFGEDLLAAARA